jgi:uncharacterized protein involved in exopolysaccharide biosynthesis
MDLIAFAELLSRERRVVLISCAVCFLLALTYALVATPMFRAEVIVIPVKEDAMGGGGASNDIEKGLGGLASLAGLGTQESGQEQTADAILDSHLLAEEFVRRNNLLPLLLPKAKRPTLWLAAKRFKDGGVEKVRKDLNKGTTKITVEWTDPTTAARWANGLVALANDLMRNHDKDDATRNIDYLDRQIEKTTDLDLRRGMYDIVETQTRTLMLANGRVDYAFRVIDPAVPPEVKARPERTLIVLGGLGLGLMLGSMIAFVRERLAERRRLHALQTRHWGELPATEPPGKSLTSPS